MFYDAIHQGRNLLIFNIFGILALPGPNVQDKDGEEACLHVQEDLHPLQHEHQAGGHKWH